MSGPLPFFNTKGDNIENEKIVRKFLGGGMKEMQKDMKKFFLKNPKKKY